MALPNFHRYSPTVGKWKVPEGQRLKFVSGQGYHTEAIPGYKPAAKVIPPTMDQQINTILNNQFGTSTTLIGKQADALKAEAASRQQNYQDAYKAAALANAAMGKDAQAGWQKAGDALGGISSALSGQVGAQTQQAVAGVDRLAASMGAPATGYDASTQQGVENYYSGVLPRNEATILGGINQQQWADRGVALNERGLQSSLADQQNTNFEILKNQSAALAEIAAKRPDAYNSLRTLFATEAQNKVTNKIANAELAARKLSDAMALKFKYAELARNAKTEKEKLKWQREENKADRAIDKINAEANKTSAAASLINAKKPNSTGTADKYNSGTYQQKLGDLMTDELQNVEQTFVYAVPTTAAKTPTLPVLSNKNGQQVVARDRETGVMLPKTQPYGDKVWANNERLRYREHVFAKLWPMIEGKIAKGNREKAKQYLRGRVWKIALNWDPRLNPEGPTDTTLESFFNSQAAPAGTARTTGTGTQTTISS